MNKRFKQNLQVTLILLDIAVLNLTMLFAFYFLGYNMTEETFSSNYRYWFLFNFSWVLIAWLGDLYHERCILSFRVFIHKTIKIYLVWLGSIIIYLLFAKSFQSSRKLVIALIIMYLVFLLLNRFIYLIIKDYFKKSSHLINNVIILGYNEVAKKIALYLEHDGINTKVMGFSENYSNVKEPTFFPIVSEIRNTIHVSKQLNVTEIYSTISPEQNEEVYDLMEQAEKECVHFKFIPDFSYFIKKPVFVEYFKDMPVLSLRNEPLEDVGNRFIKRVFDIAVSSFVIVFILTWLIPLVGLSILLESPGPIFFIQTRTGKNNKQFSCLKFRSMRNNSDSDIKSAKKGDSRITRIGSFLRRTNLDEFAQFINVFRGEMSLVGPRPHMVKHTEDFSHMVNDYMVRQLLKPGITGWAQTHGYRGEIKNHIDIMNRVQYDIWYLENWSLWLDVKIIFLTVYNVFRGEKNAY